MSAQTVFHASYNLPFIFEGLRRFDAEFEGEESDQSRRWWKGSRWSFVVGSIPYDLRRVERCSPFNDTVKANDQGRTTGFYAIASAATRSVTNASITSPALMSP